MPDMNGIETARRIRKVIGDFAPIIIVTAYDWADIEQEAYEATKQIRGMSNPIAADIPIIAMTANAFEEDKQLALAAGMNDFVTKPIEINKLVDALKSVLKQEK